jgi:hypothetical protein
MLMWRLGLIDLQAAPPLELTAPMAKGFDMGVVVVLDYLESLATFFTHPSHDQYESLESISHLPCSLVDILAG